MINKTRKIYCFIDETGQDLGSDIFIVVAVVVVSNLDETRIGNIKWHKSDYRYRIKFMEKSLSVDRKDLTVYFMKVKKPVFYYLPMVEILGRAISANSDRNTQAIVCIDGLDKSSAKKITNALRIKVSRVKLAKGVRDESEVLIRLADRWAGCIRMSLSGNEECTALLKRAEKKDLLKEL